MKGEALEPTLAAGRLDAETPLIGAEIQVLLHALAVTADAVQQPTHVVDEQPPRPRHVDEAHHAGRVAIAIGERRALDAVDGDDPGGGGDGRGGERVGSIVRKWWSERGSVCP